MLNETFSVVYKHRGVQTSYMQKKLGAFSELTNPTELQNSVMNLGTLVPNLLGDPVNELGQYVNNLKWLE